MQRYVRSRSRSRTRTRSRSASRSRRGGDKRVRSRSPAQTTSLFVKNITAQTSSEDLRELFGRYGSVRDVYIPLDYYHHQPRGFAYIETTNYAHKDFRIFLKYLQKTEELGEESQQSGVKSKPKGFDEHETYEMEFFDHRDADDAVDSLNNYALNGEVLSVQYAKGHRKTSNEMKKKYDVPPPNGNGRHRRRTRSRSPYYRSDDKYGRRDRRSSSGRSRHSGRCRRSPSVSSVSSVDSYTSRSSCSSGDSAYSSDKYHRRSRRSPCRRCDSRPRPAHSCHSHHSHHSHGGHRRRHRHHHHRPRHHKRARCCCSRHSTSKSLSRSVSPKARDIDVKADPTADEPVTAKVGDSNASSPAKLRIEESVSHNADGEKVAA